MSTGQIVLIFIVDMRVTNEVPSSWQDLQNKVCKYLNECGYHAESPKVIETVRGPVEVDVFATSDDEMLSQFICECKFWDTRVPQEKIHAFRTVVQDSGSMIGIFISKAGYQKGALKAANCSNVLLKDWNGFISMIAKKWVKNRFRSVQKLGDPLGTYTNYLDVPIEKLATKKAVQECMRLQDKYKEPYYLARSLESGFHRPEDPVELDGFLFNDFCSLFDYLEMVFVQGVREFEEFFAKNPITDWNPDLDESMHFESCILDYLTS